MESPGAAEGFLNKGAFFHGTSRGFPVSRPDFQGMLWGLPPIFQHGTVLAQVGGIHLPAYWREIPVLPAPLYRQVREPEVMKQSPPRAATPNPFMVSPKTKCSSSKGGPHHSLGCSSNTSTPKCPDSTSAKKPPSSKEPTWNSQEKSPKAHGSHKCGRSPFPSTESVRCKWKDVHSEDSHTLNSTLPIRSSMFDGLRSLMGSHSDVTEPLPPSITSTP